jgi:signal transduction histidine kinase
MSNVSSGGRAEHQAAATSKPSKPSEPSPRRARRTRATQAEAQEAPVAPSPRTRSKARPVPPTASADPSVSSSGKMSVRRRTATRRRVRESGVLGLAGRARLLSEQATSYLPPDSLATALPSIRQALFARPLDDALRSVAEELAGALSPAAVQIWVAEPALAAGERGKVGGLELTPTLRLRATARAAVRDRLEAGLEAFSPASSVPGVPLPQGADASLGGSMPRWPPHHDPLLEEVVTRRQPVTMQDAREHPLAQAWLGLVPATFCPMPGSVEDEALALGTLAAYPLRARGQFLGVLALAARGRLGPRQFAALEELADLIGLAADRDRLLSYSRSQEALAQTVVQHAPVAMAVLAGPDHVFALANPTFALLLGLESEANLAGRRLAEVVPERAERLSASLRVDAVYLSGEPQAMIELPIVLDQGLTYWNVTTSPLAAAGGGVGGALIAAVDVTRQVLARQKVQDAAEVAQERIGQMMTLHATTLAVASQLGADPRELLADILRRSIALLSARAGTVYVRDPRTNILEVVVCQGLRGDYVGGRIRVGEGLAGQVAQLGRGMIVDDYRAYPFRTAIYGDEDMTAVIAVPLVHHGQVVGVLEVLDDAERRAFTDDDLWLLDLFAAQAAQAIENARTYVELEHAYRKQRELDRMKDDFIATASHELRTPLTGVQGFLDLLMDYPGSRDEQLALDFLQRAVDSAQELAEVSERLLQTSRLDAGRLELHLGPVRLAMVAEDVLRSFRALEDAQGTAHELALDIPQEVYVQADLGRLKEVLENLVGNAVKYSPHGGRITVRLVSAQFQPSERAESELPEPGGAIEERPTLVLPHLTEAGAGGPVDPRDNPSAPAPEVITAAAVQPYWVMTLQDEGIGIPMEERPRLFGRFSRLESARISQIRGTGLGLYICRQSLRAMGGDIWLQESAPGAGSTFAFALPAATVQAPEQAGLLAASPAAQPSHGD